MGLPMTLAPLGTSEVTTDPIPTTALDPIVTPFATRTPVPKKTQEPIFTCPDRTHPGDR